MANMNNALRWTMAVTVVVMTMAVMADGVAGGESRSVMPLQVVARREGMREEELARSSIPRDTSDEHSAAATKEVVGAEEECTRVRVTTESGAVEGVVDAGVASFKGIPYARPPLGPLRFRPPQRVLPWEGVLDASEWGERCVQVEYATRMGSEDCLFVNVFAPASGVASPSGSDPLPVLVWIHGGGYIKGTSAYYDPTHMIREAPEPVVVVSMNYRLGAIGFLSLAEGQREEDWNGGIADQQEALRWVRENIAHFGGSPAHVTIFGESAGGGSVMIHMAMESSQSLFNAAIAQSPFSLVANTTAGKAISQGVAQQVGCGHAQGAALLACMQAVPVEKLRQSIGPVYGYTLLPHHPIAAYKQGEGAVNGVPHIIGWNAREGDLFVNVLAGVRNRTLSDAAYKQLMAGVFESDGLLSFALDLYEEAREMHGNYYAMAHAIGDYWITCGAMVALNATAAPSARLPPWYAYTFREIHKSGAPATHGSELPYVFASPRPRYSADVRRAIVEWWNAFAVAYNPNHVAELLTGVRPRRSARASWEAFSVYDTQSVLSIDEHAAMTPLSGQYYCKEWNEQYYSRL